MVFGVDFASGGFPALAPWWIWIWLEVASAAPLVALTAARELTRVEPASEDAARLVGASGWRIARDLIWPVVRPGLARAGALVFTWTLVEPGAPLALGLRRTLAFQIVESAQGANPLPRAAVLALEAISAALIVRVLLRWLGGTPNSSLSQATATRAQYARRFQSVILILFLAGCAAAAWIPILCLFSAGGLLGRWLNVGARTTTTLLSTLRTPESTRLLAATLVLGVSVSIIDIIFARWVAALAGNRRTIFLRLTTWPEVVPPLTLGVGALAIPWLGRMLEDQLRGAGSGGASRLVGFASDLLDPYLAPGLLLTVAVAVVRLPFLARAMDSGRRRARAVLVDASISMGASSREARRAPSQGWFGLSFGTLFLALAMGATNLAPALLLVPTDRDRPVTAGILWLAEEPGDELNRAAALGAFVIALNLVALAAASRGQFRSLAVWIRSGP
jgi:iron(III) transport system permease protein